MFYIEGSCTRTLKDWIFVPNAVKNQKATAVQNEAILFDS